MSAAINRVNLDDGINMVLDGARGAFSGALIIGVARAVQWTMTNGGLVDPLVRNQSDAQRLGLCEHSGYVHCKFLCQCPDSIRLRTGHRGHANYGSIG